MNEGACQLDQCFVKEPLGLGSLSQPKLLQNLVSLEKKLLVEAFKIPQVMSVQVPTLVRPNQASDLIGFVAHGLNSNDLRTD
jgi:hypothetical protein